MGAEPGPVDDAFERSRQERRGVRQASGELEEVLARPASHDPKAWSRATADCLLRLLAAFESHVRQSEGADGLLAEIVTVAPRLANSVNQIKGEHRGIIANVSRLESEARANEDMTGIQGVREEALNVLRAIASHRQRGADLIYEAYSVDIEAGD